MIVSKIISSVIFLKLFQAHQISRVAFNVSRNLTILTINSVNGIIETNRPDEKNRQYQAVIKRGDLLLNRVQKLSRVINI